VWDEVAACRGDRVRFERSTTVLSTILIVILVLMLIGAMPTWNHSRSWGAFPSGGIGLILIILIVLMLTNRI